LPFDLVHWDLLAPTKTFYFGSRNFQHNLSVSVEEIYKLMDIIELQIVYKTYNLFTYEEFLLPEIEVSTNQISRVYGINKSMKI
jgi:hypothetical protein